MAEIRPTDAVEQVVAPAAIERALSIYQQLDEHDQSGGLAGSENPDPAYLRNG